MNQRQLVFRCQSWSDTGDLPGGSLDQCEEHGDAIGTLGVRSSRVVLEIATVNDDAGVRHPEHPDSLVDRPYWSGRLRQPQSVPRSRRTLDYRLPTINSKRVAVS